MSIKQIQNTLGVISDGLWGNISQASLNKSNLKLDVSWDKLRAWAGNFTQSQVDGFNAVLKAINDSAQAKNPLYAAYILATVWHETDKTMQPIAEYGKGKTRKYGQWFSNSKGQKYGYANGQGGVYLQADCPFLFYGRGYCQLTWFDNYKKLGGMIGVDLIKNPELALKTDVAAKVLIAGMLSGAFTGMSLPKCVKSGNNSDYTKARCIINGNDCDGLIAGHAIRFLDCLVLT